MPEITIVIPTHQRRALIGPTLLGALEQEDVDLEVIVVDDASRDGTAECLRELGEPRLRVFRFDENSGQAHARNLGIREARGEWLAFLDDDDLWDPRKLREQLDAAAAVDAQIAYSVAVVLDEDLDPLLVYYPPPGEEQPRSILRSSSVPAGSSNLIARTELLRAIGGVDEDLDALADWDLFTRLLLNGRAAAVESPHVGYVLRSGSISAGLMDRHFADFDLLADRYRDERERFGVEIDGVQFSRWLAGGLRRGGNRRDARRAYMKGARDYRSVGNAVRAGALALGEPLPWHRRRERVPEWANPAWLDLYRPGGRLRRSLDSLVPASR